jgi:protein-S-isoprenylcysteine O-methyltransferase Ste14
MSETETPNTSQTGVIIKLGSLSITGWWALLILIVVLVLVASLIAHARPSPGMLLSGMVWLMFVTYWSIAAKNRAADRNSESSTSRMRHAVMLDLALLLLFIPVPFLTRYFLPAWRWRVAAGLSVQIASMLLAFWARRHLGRNWSAEVRVAENHSLVLTGPYRVLRHPIYSAMVGMFAGTAIVSAQWHALVAIVVLLIAYRRKIQMEEDAMGATFGADYDQYRRASWALLPGIY